MSLPKLAMTIPEAAESVGMSEKAVRAAIKAGHLRAKRQGVNEVGDGTGKYVILLPALEAWLDSLADA